MLTAEEINRRRRERRASESAEEREARLARGRAAYARNAEKRRAWSLAWYYRNQEERKAVMRERRQAHPEIFREYEARWRANNLDKRCDKEARRRVRLRGAGVVESVDRSALYERDGGKCHICGRKVSRSKFHLDHLVPVARGGDHTAKNLRVAHPRCNIARGDGRLPAQLLLIGD